MKTHTPLIACLALAFVSPGTVAAATIAFEFTPQLIAGTDPNGLSSATWVFEFEVTQSQYALSGTFNDTAFSSSGAMLTISGAGNSGLDGTYLISSTGTGGDFVFIADLFGNTQVALQGPSNTTSGFSFGGVNVSSFGASAPSFGSPSVGDAVDVIPFNSMSFTTSGFTADSGSFSFTSSPVPEPSALAFCALAVPFLFRRRTPRNR